jgi:hypothetical protein
MLRRSDCSNQGTAVNNCAHLKWMTFSLQQQSNSSGDVPCLWFPYHFLRNLKMKEALLLPPNHLDKDCGLCRSNGCQVFEVTKAPHVSVDILSKS